jgi:hypothetical protein
MAVSLNKNVCKSQEDYLAGRRSLPVPIFGSLSKASPAEPAAVLTSGLFRPGARSRFRRRSTNQLELL